MSNQKNKSTLLKDTMVLFLITLVAGFALGLVYEVTAPIIADRRLQAKADTYKKVYQSASEFRVSPSLDTKAAAAAESVLAENGYEGIGVDEALEAVNESGEVIGYVVSVSTGAGFNGNITITFGYSIDGTIQGLEFLSIAETVGLGLKVKEPSFKEQFVNKQVDKFVLTSSSSNDNEIDMISGATISSKAVLDAVNAGICFITQSVVVN